jgi:hypothetical protein
LLQAGEFCPQPCKLWLLQIRKATRHEGRTSEHFSLQGAVNWRRGHAVFTFQHTRGISNSTSSRRSPAFCSRS